MGKRIVCCMLLLLTFMSATVVAQDKDRNKSFSSWDNYEITTEKVGTDGTKFVKVWGFAKKEDAAIMQAKKNAVHACLFRGLPGNTSAMNTPPICSPQTPSRLMKLISRISSKPVALTWLISI